MYQQLDENSDHAIESQGLNINKKVVENRLANTMKNF